MEPLFSFEELVRYTKHRSPLVRGWALERIQTIFPTQGKDIALRLLEDQDPLVRDKALHYIEKHPQLFIHEAHNISQKIIHLAPELPQLSLFLALRVLEALDTVEDFFDEFIILFKEKKESWVGELVIQCFSSLFEKSPEKALDYLIDYQEKFEEELEIKAQALLSWLKNNEDLIVSVCQKNPKYLPTFVKNLPIIFDPQEWEGYLEIVPREVISLWKKRSRKRAQEELKRWLLHTLSSLKEEAISRHGEINFRRFLQREKGLGFVFRLAEKVVQTLSTTKKKENIFFIEALFLLILPLLWGKRFIGLSERPSLEEALEIYLERDRPSFREDELLKELLLSSLHDQEAKERIVSSLREALIGDTYACERAVLLIKEGRIKELKKDLVNLLEQSIDENWPEITYILDALVVFFPDEELEEALLDLLRRKQSVDPLFVLEHFPTKRVAEVFCQEFGWLIEDQAFMRDEVLYFAHPCILNRLKEKIHWQAEGWEKAFTVLFHLFEPKFPYLSEIERRAYEKELEFLSQGLSKEPEEPVAIGVTCRRCGLFFTPCPRTIFLYRNKNIEIPEEITCPRCGTKDDYEIEKGSKLRIEFLALLDRPQKGDPLLRQIIPIDKFFFEIDGQVREIRSFKKIKDTYLKAIRNNPEDPSLIGGYIFVLLRAKLLKEAEEYIARLEKIAPEAVDLFFVKALYFRLKERPKEALEYYVKTLEALASGAPTYRFRGARQVQFLREILSEAKKYAHLVGERLPLEEHKLLQKTPKKIGRNDPCPCGSGKKYKNCCLREEKAPKEQTSVTPAEERVERLIWGFIYKKAKSDLKTFVANFLEGMKPLQEKDQSDQSFLKNKFLLELGNLLFFYFGRVSSGRNILEEFLRLKGKNLSLEEQSIVKGYLQTYLSLFELIETDQKCWITLKDLLTEKEYRVKDFRAATSYPLGEFVLGHVVNVGPYFRFGKIGITIPPIFVSVLKDRLEKLFSSSKEKDFISFSRKYASKIVFASFEILSQGFEPRFITPEGDKVVFLKAIYKTKTPEKIKNLLTAANFISQDENTFSLVKPVETSSLASPSAEAVPGTIIISKRIAEDLEEIGTVTFEKDYIVLEALSEARMKNLKEIFEKLTGSRARFVFDVLSEAKTRASMSKLKEGFLPENKELPPEEHAEWRLKELLAWLDSPDAVLGGKTPREAWQDPELRKKVEDLLRRFAYVEEQYQREGKPSVNINLLRNMLER